MVDDLLYPFRRIALSLSLAFTETRSRPILLLRTLLAIGLSVLGISVAIALQSVFFILLGAYIAIVSAFIAVGLWHRLWCDNCSGPIDEESA